MSIALYKKHNACVCACGNGACYRAMYGILSMYFIVKKHEVKKKKRKIKMVRILRERELQFFVDKLYNSLIT